MFTKGEHSVRREIISLVHEFFRKERLHLEETFCFRCWGEGSKSFPLSLELQTFEKGGISIRRKYEIKLYTWKYQNYGNCRLPKSPIIDSPSITWEEE